MSEKYSIRDALESDQTKATVLHAILRNKYGEEWYDWDLATIALEVQDDFQAELSSSAGNRIGALQLLMTSDAFFKRLDAFMAIADAMATGEPFFDVFDPLTFQEAAWAIAEAALNREMLPFGYPIKHYLKLVLAEGGYAGDYPDLFDAVFSADTVDEAAAIRAEVAAVDNNPNTNVLNAYIDDELADIVYQLDAIPSLENIDNILLASEDATLVDALGQND